MSLNSSPAERAQPDRVVSIPAVADQLDVSTKTVRRFIASAALPHHRIGRQIRISQRDITVFLALRRSTNTGVH